MTTTSNKASELKRLHDLYGPLEDGMYVPTADPFAGSPTKVVVRDMIVDMEQLNTDLAAKTPDWTELEVYADILVFPLHSVTYDQFAFRLAGQKATFFARSIDVVDGSALFVNYHAHTQLTIYTAEISGGTLLFSGLGNDPTKSVVLPLQSGSVGLSISGAGPAASAVSAVPAELVNLGEAGYWLLESSFNAGSALAYADTDLASSILAWVSLTAAFGADKELQQLALNAADMQSYVKQLQRTITFVPPLSHGLYKDVAGEYLKSATAFETAFNNQVAELANLKNVDSFVNANEQYFTDQTGVAVRLVTQMKQNVTKAEAVLKQNSNKVDGLVGHDGAIHGAMGVFKDGVEKYKQEQTNKAIIGTITAVVEVGACVGAMAFGQEEAAAPAAAAVAEVAKAGEAAAETVSTLNKLVEAMKKIAEVIKKLKELIEKLKAAQEAIESLVEADSLKTSDFGKGITVPDDQAKDIFDSAYWDTFTINFEAILTPYTTGETKIDGAAGYLQQLQYLAVFGKAVYANQVTVTQLRQKLFKLVLEHEVAQKQQTRLKGLVDSEEAQEELLQHAKIITYQNLLRVKSRVVFYMDEQTAAERYWAVSPVPLIASMPSLADTVGELQDKLAGIEAARLAAMERFMPTPSDMDERLQLPQEAVAQMRATGQLSWTIPLDLKAFDGWGRVRVERLRTYINDEAVTDPSITITIDVSTSAHYIDRYKGIHDLQYVSTPLTKTFQYTLNNKSKPVADGTIARKTDPDYFEPTSFTTWTISIDKSSPVDLSKLTSVELQLKGTFCSIK